MMTGWILVLLVVLNYLIIWPPPFYLFIFSHITHKNDNYLDIDKIRQIYKFITK